MLGVFLRFRVARSSSTVVTPAPHHPMSRQRSPIISSLVEAEADDKRLMRMPQWLLMFIGRSRHVCRLVRGRAKYSAMCWLSISSVRLD